MKILKERVTDFPVLELLLAFAVVDIVSILY